MKTYAVNIEKVSIENNSLQKVLYKNKQSSLIVISLKPGESTEERTEEFNQFIRCEIGQGRVVLDHISHEIDHGFAMIIPAGTKQSIVNTSPNRIMRLYTLYFS